MPRQAKPARLWLRPPAGDREAVWVILHRGKQISTGCGETEIAEAERRLEEYLADRRQPTSYQGPRDPAVVPVADVINVYLDEVVPKQANKPKAIERMGRLLDWWGDKMLSDVSPATCRAYTDHRNEARRKERQAKKKKKSGQDKVETGGSRRDLEDLRAAINHHAKRNLHKGVVMVELPPKGERRTAWLTRSEAAKLIWTCYRHGRTVRLPRGRSKGEKIESEWHDLRHIARFIIMGLYTGSRPGAILTASIHAGANRSFIDLESGIFYRLAEGKAETNKRQPPAPIPARLLAHLRRWRDKKIIASHVVEWEGAPVKSIKVGWKRALDLSKIGKKATPHTLRHTAATWLMQLGVDIWEAAGYLGMSEQVLRDVYGHHHPDFMRNAADKITRKRARQ